VLLVALVGGDGDRGAVATARGDKARGDGGPFFNYMTLSS